MKQKIKLQDIRSNQEESVNTPPVNWITEMNNPTPKTLASTSDKIPLYYGGGGDRKIVSAVTGKEYLFIAGVPTYVDPIDAEYFLTLTKESGCCGSSYKTQLFGKE